MNINYSHSSTIIQETQDTLFWKCNTSIPSNIFGIKFYHPHNDPNSVWSTVFFLFFAVGSIEINAPDYRRSRSADPLDYTGWNRIYVQTLLNVIACEKYESKILYNICPVTVCFQRRHHHQMAQAIKLSHHGSLIVTMGVRSTLVHLKAGSSALHGILSNMP
jgi:hypothetical protein